MWTVLKVILVIAVLYVIFFIFPNVTELPLGTEEVVQTMSAMVYKFRLINPFFNILWTYFVYVLLVETLLFTWHWLKWLVEHIR